MFLNNGTHVLSSTNDDQIGAAASLLGKRGDGPWSPHEGARTTVFLPRGTARVSSLVAFMASPASCPVPL
jgi:hypothetical protein